MTIGEALVSFAVLAGILTIIPGLDTALVLRASITSSRRVAYATALGICSGSFVWGAAAAVGAAALLAASEFAFTVLKLAGAVYMAWFGIALIIASFRGARPTLAELGRPSTGLAAAFGRGALTNLLNPKVGVFYIALIPQFIPDGTIPVLMGLLLALVHVVETILWFTGIIVASHVTRRWLANDRAARWIDRVTGTLFVGFGAILAIEARTP